MIIAFTVGIIVTASVAFTIGAITGYAARQHQEIEEKMQAMRNSKYFV